LNADEVCGFISSIREGMNRATKVTGDRQGQRTILAQSDRQAAGKRTEPKFLLPERGIERQLFFVVEGVRPLGYVVERLAVWWFH
jgi:hypothetical protein